LELEVLELEVSDPVVLELEVSDPVVGFGLIGITGITGITGFGGKGGGLGLLCGSNGLGSSRHNGFRNLA
jgi:hypothetical protein